MRKIIIIGIIALFLLSSSVFGQKSTKIAFQDDVRVSFVNQEPDPVEPGDYLEVRFKFENYGSEEAPSIQVEMLTEYPFSLPPGEEAVQNIGSLQPRQLGDTGIIVKYRLRIDQNAVEGTSDLRIRYRVGNNEWVKPDPFSIDIQTHDAILNIESVEVFPEMVPPGGKAKLKLHLKNIADSLLKDVTTKLELTSVPLATLKSSDEKTIKRIEGNKEAVIEFDLIAEPDAASDLYRLPINLRYNDQLGTGYNKSVSVGITVGTVPDIYTGIDSTTIKKAGMQGEVVVKFVNKGLTDIKLLNVKLDKNDSFTLLSSQEVYIGNIDSDDYESAEFKVYAKDVKADKLLLPISLEYLDSNNKEYSTKVKLEIPLYSTKDAKKMGLVKGNGSTGIFIVIIVVVVGIFLYRKFRKKKEK